MLATGQRARFAKRREKERCRRRNQHRTPSVNSWQQIVSVSFSITSRWYFLFFSWNKVHCTGVGVSSPHVTASKEELDLTTQWAKVMEAIKPRRGDLAERLRCRRWLELYVPLNNLNNRHGTSSRRKCWMLFVNNNMACGTWCSVLLCTIYIQHTVLASVWTHIAVIWMVHPEKNIP